MYRAPKHRETGETSLHAFTKKKVVIYKNGKRQAKDKHMYIRILDFLIPKNSLYCVCFFVKNLPKFSEKIFACL